MSDSHAPNRCHGAKTCDRCGRQMQVIDSRPMFLITRRRYKCKCGERSATIERKDRAYRTRIEGHHP